MILGAVALAITTATSVYKPLVDKKGQIQLISICNRDSGAATFRLYITQTPTALVAKNYIYFDAAIAANTTIFITTPFTILPTDTIGAYSSNAVTTIQIIGEEI